MYLEKDEMKFTILYTISQYAVPINMEDLSNILTWEKEVMEYFDLSIMLSELVEDGYIDKKYYRNKEAYYLTVKGEETNRFFMERVPASIRGRIDDAIGHIKYEELANPNIITGEIVPLDEKQYMARCYIMDNKIPLMDLNLYVGTKIEAEKVAAYFKKNAEKVYKDILKSLIPEISEE